jgi:hypothetical protein
MLRDELLHVALFAQQAVVHETRDDVIDGVLRMPLAEQAPGQLVSAEIAPGQERERGRADGAIALTRPAVDLSR